MLGSITPLGERSRNSRWSLTLLYFMAGSALGGTTAGTILGAIGSRIHLSPTTATALLVGLVAVGAAVDSRLIAIRIPSPRRQVDDAWLRRYRSWVYGLGFGVQLGFGAATTIVTAAVYVTLAASLLSGSAVWGGAIGLLYGLLRALPVVFVRRVKTTAHLASVHPFLRRVEPIATRWSTVALTTVAVLSGGTLVIHTLIARGG